jgi:hypothetical protein
MATEHDKKHGHVHPTGERTIGYERTDADVSGVVWFLAVLVISAVIIHLGLGVFYHALIDYTDKHDARPTPAAARVAQQRLQERKARGEKVTPEDAGKLAESLGAAQGGMQYERTLDRLIQSFPQPRLQEDDVRDMRELRTYEDSQLDNYSWVDKNTGSVRIPITRAMQLIVQRGVPGGNASAGAPGLQIQAPGGTTAAPQPTTSSKRTGQPH